MGFVKQAMLLGSGDNSIVTTEAYAINGEYDIDSLGGIMSFNLPYLLADQKNVDITSGVDITRLKKFDTVKVFFGEFTQDPGDITQSTQAQLTASLETGGAGLTLIFDGYVDKIKLTKTKQSFIYQINALTTIGLGNDRTFEWQKKDGGNVTTTVALILDLSGLGADREVGGVLLKGVNIPFVSEIAATDNIPLQIDGGKTAKESLMQIRDKYAVILHQAGDGILRLSTAEFFDNSASSVLYQFSFKEGNIFDLDYGDLTSDYNAVLVIGFPPNFGIALDAIAVQNNGGNVNYLRFEQRDLKGNEQCETVARNKLLELERNFSISFKTSFNPKFAVGQVFQMNDGDRFDGTAKWIIKRVTFTIDKQDVSATIQGYTHSLTLLPEDIVLSNTGIADIDILELRPKLNDILGWNAELNQ